MKKGYFVLFCIVALIVVAGSLFAYQLRTTTGSSSSLKPTSIRLKWLDQAQFAGYYWAKDSGNYKEAGLDVKLEPGGPDISPLQMVVNGSNDFGVIGADQILLAREKGIPVVAIAVIYQDTSVSFASLATSGIKTPKDLEGKKVAIAFGRDEEVVYKAMLNNAGVDRTKIKELPLSPGLAQLASDSVDSQMVYETNEPVLYQNEGYDINLIKARDYGVHFYSDTLFTTEKLIKEKPDLVASVVKASLEGWSSSFVDTEKAAGIIALQNKNLDPKTQKKSLELSKPLIFNNGNIGFSEMHRWEEMQRIMIEQGVMKEKVDVSTVFTNRFIAKQ